MKILLHRSKSSQPERGIALITTLLLMIMLSALAVAFVLAINTETRLQGTDKGSTRAYYGAEAGMEKMIADLNTLYQNQASPAVNDITSLGATSFYPSISGINYNEYAYSVQASPPPNASAPLQYQSTVSSGPNQGLIASVIPIGLAVTADTGTQEEVRMTRQVEVALIPVFQFGVFCDADCSFFAGPRMSITGRVQTNGDLYITPQGTTTFEAQLRTAKEIVRDTLANGLAASTNNYTGTALVPTTNGACNGGAASSTCVALSLTPDQGSWLNGKWPYTGTSPVGNTQGNVNGSWSSISGSYNGFVLAREDGVVPMKLPFVGKGVSSIEILRQPETTPPLPDNTITTDSRLYNKAQIRVLLVDDPKELPNGASDPDNVRLANVVGNAVDYHQGVPVWQPAACPSSTTGACNTYFAEARKDAFIPVPPVPPATIPTYITDANWATAAVNAGGTIQADNTQTSYTVDPTKIDTTAPPIGPQPGSWSLLDGWLRVEIRTGPLLSNYKAVTREWLQLGFARDFTPPTAPGTNTVNPRAILILQQKANRTGTPSCPGDLLKDPASTSCNVGAQTRNNFYPINIYDTREGEPRDLNNNNYGCTVNGIINITEIDVGNLSKWLQGAFGGSGTQVESTTQNGYLLYFSDHRGLQADVNGNKRGAYGFEDVINTDNLGTPNSGLDAGEDVEQPGAPGQPADVGFGALETVGAKNLGLGFGFAPNALADTGGVPSVFTRLNTCNLGRANWVSGARHAVRLIDGGPGNLPVRPVNNSPDPSNVGGFTLGTDNPAYILGDYNMSAATCPSCMVGTNGTPPPYPGTYNHASAAVLADTVTLLSNAWNDMESFTNPGKVTARVASTTYYRVAIASGKGVNFSRPRYTGAQTPIGGTPSDPGVTGSVTTSPPGDFGTDGGDHNFLRYLESWGGVTSNYSGSRVSLYYSQYATGTFKCCQSVYKPPARHYFFDLDFLNINMEPPATPRFQEVINVGYKQDMSYR